MEIGNLYSSLLIPKQKMCFYIKNWNDNQNKIHLVKILRATTGVINVLLKAF